MNYVGNIDDLRDTLVAVNDLLDTSHLSYATQQQLKGFKAELEEQIRSRVAEEDDGLRAA